MKSNNPAGGLTRAQLLRLIIASSNRARAGFTTLVLAYGLAQVWLPVAGHRRSVLGAAIVTGAFALISVAAVAIALLARDQSLRSVSPEAADAIAGTLASCGLPLPDAMTVRGLPLVTSKIRVLPDRRATLSIGLPLLLALPVADLPVLAAHELAIAAEPYPILAGVLWRRRQGEEWLSDGLARTGRGQKARARRAARFLAATDRFARDIRTRADAAAVAAAGGTDAAAAALYRREVVATDVTEFSGRFSLLMRKRRRIPAQLYTGWFQVQQEGIAVWEQLPAPDLDRFFAEHPDLAAAERAPLERLAMRMRLGEWGRPAACVVPDKVEKRLVPEMATAFVSGKPARPTPDEQLDITLVYHAVTDDSALLDAAGEVLGRQASRADAFDLIISPRMLELARLMLDPEDVDEEGPNGGVSRGILLAWLLTAAQTERGLLQLDPMRRRLLTGPSGEHFDVARYVTAALESDAGAQGLRSLLIS